MTLWPPLEADVGDRPLAGVRVLDLSRVLAGPYCAMLLADLGADVLKVEGPDGDETRRWGPPFLGDTASYYFAANRNKRAVVLDLKQDDDRALADELIALADVVLDNYTGSVARRLALEHEDIVAINPGVIHLRISGFGPEEPDRPGYDLVTQALAGLMAITGGPDEPPSKVGVAISDIVAGLFGTVGVLAELYRRRDTGTAPRLDVSLYDATTAILANQAMNWLLCGMDSERMGSDHPNVTPYGAFETATSPIILAIGTDGQFLTLCDVLGDPDLASDGRFAGNSDRITHRDQLRVRLEELLRARPADEWIAELQRRGVPNARVRSVGEALSAPEARALASIDHPTIGAVAQALSPIRRDGEYLAPYLAPPRLDEHSASVLDRDDAADA